MQLIIACSENAKLAHQYSGGHNGKLAPMYLWGPAQKWVVELRLGHYQDSSHKAAVPSAHLHLRGGGGKWTEWLLGGEDPSGGWREVPDSTTPSQHPVHEPPHTHQHSQSQPSWRGPKWNSTWLSRSGDYSLLSGAGTAVVASSWTPRSRWISSEAACHQGWSEQPLGMGFKWLWLRKSFSGESRSSLWKWTTCW